MTTSKPCRYPAQRFCYLIRPTAFSSRISPAVRTVELEAACSIPDILIPHPRPAPATRTQLRSVGMSRENLTMCLNQKYTKDHISSNPQMRAFRPNLTLPPTPGEVRTYKSSMLNALFQLTLDPSNVMVNDSKAERGHVSPPTRIAHKNPPVNRKLKKCQYARQHRPTEKIVAIMFTSRVCGALTSGKNYSAGYCAGGVGTNSVERSSPLPLRGLSRSPGVQERATTARV